MTQEEIRGRLMQLAEEDYKKFSSALLPGTKNVLGVRLPKLRALAKEMAAGDCTAFLGAQPLSMEEKLLQGMVIGFLRLPVEEHLALVAAYVPQIDNWSVCDSFCASCKFTAKNSEAVWAFLQPYLHSEEEFPARFGAVMILDYFLTEEYITRALQALDEIPAMGQYYTQMAQAWALATALAKQPQPTWAYLRGTPHLDDFTFNKTIQKAVESYRISAADKATLRSLRRSNKK